MTRWRQTSITRRNFCWISYEAPLYATDVDSAMICGVLVLVACAAGMETDWREGIDELGLLSSLRLLDNLCTQLVDG